MPAVSVVIPTYNRARDLERALASVRAQTFTDWEAVVVDNHSTDDTDSVVSRFGDPRIKLHKIHNDGIIAASRNLGIHRASGDLIAFLDSDDWWTTDKLAKSLPAFAAGADVVYHDLCAVFREHQRLLWRTASTRQLTTPVAEDLVAGGNALVTSGVTMRKSVLDRIAGFSEKRDWIGMEDYDAWIRASRVTDRFVRVPGRLGYHWVGGGNTTNARRTLALLGVFEAEHGAHFRSSHPEAPLYWVDYQRCRSSIELGDLEAARESIRRVPLTGVRPAMALRVVGTRLQIAWNRLRSLAPDANQAEAASSGGAKATRPSRPPARPGPSGRMKVLFIAPLPPPVTGHSLVSRALLDDLSQRHSVSVVDLSTNSQHDGRVTAKRSAAVARSLVDVLRKLPGSDAIYLTISESVAGNIKDLLIYALTTGKLSRLVIHLHGGTIGRELFDRLPWLRAANRFFLRRLGGVVVTGPSHLGIFEGMIDAHRVHLVPNFADDGLFVSEVAIRQKFSSSSPLRVLYMSGMTELKGYDLLADACLRLPPAVQGNIVVDFAGQFASPTAETAFREKIQRVPSLRYHGMVNGEAKRALFAAAHVFCLPSGHFEGQPISILEAYASGCVVLTTTPGGVLDIFTPGVNGFAIEPRTAEAISTLLTQVFTERTTLLPIAVANSRLATERFRVATYTTAVRRILESRAAS